MTYSMTVAQPIDLGQLAGELDDAASLSMSEDGATRVVTAHDTTTEAQLQAAIDAHVPVVRPKPEAVTAATNAVAAMVVQARAQSGDLTPAEADTVAAAFPVWAAGETVAVGDLRYFDGKLVEVIQAHTTQPDWTPDVVPALWKTWRDAEAVEPWVQPNSTNPYPLGAKVTHNGKTWESLHASNVWEPPTQWREIPA